MMNRALFRLTNAVFGARRIRLSAAASTAAPFPARTPLETLLIDEDFYLAECAVIRPRGDAPDRAGRRDRR